MVFESLSCVAAVLLIASVLRVIQLYYFTRIGDYLLFGLVNLSLIINSVLQSLYGFSNLISSVSGVVVLNLLFLLFIRVTDKNSVTFQIIAMNILNFTYIAMALYETYVDPNLSLWRMMVFNFMLFFIGISGYSNFVKSTMVESRFRRTGYIIWSFMTLMFAFAAALRLLSIGVLLIENNERTLLFFELMIAVVRVLIVLYSIFLLYFSIKSPEFLVLTYQQVIRALKAFKKVTELDLVENEKKESYEEDPERLMAYLRQVSKLVPKE